MRLIIQIPAYNEEETLATTLSQLPRRLPGITQLEWLVIDDGSSDATADIARAYGVHHLLRFSRHRGLAAAFSAGLEACLELGADIIVNTDADNQYRAADIPKLIEPILEDQADLVVGTRPIEGMEEFSGVKKLLQRWGSLVVRRLSRTEVADCTSGFRAFRRDAALRLKVFGRYTYTLETIIHAGCQGMKVTSVPVRTNRVTRPSRLVKSIPSYVLRSALTIVRQYCFYRPFVVFIIPGLTAIGFGSALGLQFLFCYLRGDASAHLPELVVAVGLHCIGFLSVGVGLVADWLMMSRQVMEGLERQVQRLRRDFSVDSRELASRSESLATKPELGFLTLLARREITLESRGSSSEH